MERRFRCRLRGRAGQVPNHHAWGRTYQHALKEVDAAALAVAETPDEIVRILTYALNGTLGYLG